MGEQKQKIGPVGPGYRFGKLTVASDTGKRKNGYIIWNCTCDCGGSIEMAVPAIRRGTVLDCGCETKVKPGTKDLTGVRFGKLVALAPTEERKYQTTVWRCACDCGNMAYVAAGQLLKGYVKSCGCLSHPPVQDLVGKRYGRLTVLSYVGRRDGQHIWLCRCDCGAEQEVAQVMLQHGRTTSCGNHKAEMIRGNLKLVDGTSVTMLEATKKHKYSSNTSGYNGVHYDKHSRKWMAQITFRRKTYTLGLFDEIGDAVKARKQGEEMHENFLEWYYSEYRKDGKHSRDEGTSGDGVSQDGNIQAGL